MYGMNTMSERDEERGERRNREEEEGVVSVISDGR